MARRIRHARRRRPHKGRKLTKTQKTQVKRLIGIREEPKNFDFAQASTGILFAGSLLGPIINPAQGVADLQRVGDVISHKTLTVRGSVTTGDATNLMRVIFFKWHLDNNATPPTVGTIIQDTVSLSFLSPLNETSQKAGKFTVLKDKIFATTTSGANQVIAFTWNFFGRRLGAKKQTFNNGLISGYNNIYCLALSDSVAAPNPSIAFESRMVYSDA